MRMVTRVPICRCTRPLKPYHGVLARTTTQSLMLSESSGFRAPGNSFRLASRMASASARASLSRRRSSMESPTIFRVLRPVTDDFNSCRTPFSFRLASSWRAWNCFSSWLRRRSCRAKRSTSMTSMSFSLCSSWACFVLTRSCSSAFFSSASASVSLERTMDAFSCTSSSWALRFSASSDCWSSSSSDSARSTSLRGSFRRSAVSMACDSPISFRVMRNVGLPSLYSMAAISVRSSVSAQFLSCMLCVVATMREPDSRNASMTARASAAPWAGSVPVPASSSMTSAR
mmetsp:Transcript_16385/g.49325  ORF Transcript_16385/g.49325 Transcript_16385/m.49325 type:complete len:287 (+) Transcript_16385:221-1081(+)